MESAVEEQNQLGGTPRKNKVIRKLTVKVKKSSKSNNKTSCEAMRRAK